jgi:hypothetical protein
MKARMLIHTAALCCAVLIFISCQKNAASVDYNTESTIHSDDQNRISIEVDAVANEANLLLEATSGFSGKTQNPQSQICDATVAVDTANNPKTITITYNGTNCLGNRSRTGVIILSMAQGVRWRDAGAQLNISFQNFKITRLSDNKSITLNGTQTYTNVTGGILIQLPALGTITHTIASSNMSVTFDNNSERTWQVARQRVFSYNNGIVITITGLHSQNGINGIAEWGMNRFGNAFTTAITQPLLLKQNCSFRPGSGQVEHTTSLFTATVSLGLDANGNPTGCPGTAPYYLKVVWTNPAGNTRSALLPY